MKSRTLLTIYAYILTLVFALCALFSYAAEHNTTYMIFALLALVSYTLPLTKK